MSGRAKFARKRDENEPEIVAALIAMGASVTRLDGAGLPDLLVGFRGVTVLLEVKMPLGPRGGLPNHYDGIGGRGDLTAPQVEWWDDWRGAIPIVVRSAAEAVHAVEWGVGVMRLGK